MRFIVTFSYAYIVNFITIHLPLFSLHLHLSLVPFLPQELLISKII